MKFIFGAMVCLVLLFSVGAHATAYTVKRGDTLASVARSHYGEPVFGPKGTINKIYRLNPWAKTKPALEPGQMIVLETKSGETKVGPGPSAPESATESEAASEEKPSSRATVTVTPAPSQLSTELPPESKSEVEKPVALRPAEPSAAAEHAAAPERHEEPKGESKGEQKNEEEAGPRSEFAVIGSYTQIQKSATDVATGTNYTLSSSPAYALELAWDKGWNNSFSTVASYTFTQISSNETSNLTGSKVIDNMTLGMAELALLNRVAKRFRIGLGVAYGDHIFVENFVATPVDPSIYKLAFFNPFLMAEWTAFENESFESALEVKADSLPAQVGNGHDLTSGYAISAEVSLAEKFKHWTALYAVKYETENQTRTDSNETSTRWDFRIGALF